MIYLYLDPKTAAQMHVLLADDQPKVRFALRVLLKRQPGLKVTGEAFDADSLLNQIKAKSCDVLLLGWELPGLTDVGSLPALRQIRPELFIIALSGRPEAQREALDAGANIFVSKTDPPERLLAALERSRARYRYEPATAYLGGGAMSSANR